MSSRPTGLVAAATLLLGCSTVPTLRTEFAPPPSKTYRVEPYVWLPSLRGDVPDGTGSPIDVDFIGLDDLDYALMLSVEARPPELAWAVLFDSLYAHFEDDGGLVGREVDGRMFEWAAAYAGTEERNVEWLAGLRYWNVGVDIDIAPVGSPSRDESWVDPLVGVRAVRRLHRAWSLHARADVGGGIESDWTYQLRAEVRRTAGAQGEFQLGYRHLYVDFGDFEYEVALSGPILGLRWSF